MLDTSFCSHIQEAKKQTLDDVVTYIAEAVADRATRGLNYGVVLVPEGLIEFIPAIKAVAI